jgi:hypothetical protein
MFTLLLDWLDAFTGLWITFLYYVAILIVVLQVRKQIMIERRMHLVHVHSYWDQLWRVIFWGAMAGIFTSALFLFVGTSLTVDMLIILWALALILALVRVRWLCFAYAAGVMGLLQVIAHLWTNSPELNENAPQWIELLRTLDMSSAFLLIGILHIMEALLVFFLGGKMSIPLFFRGKRGKPIGGFFLQGSWPIPILIFTPIGLLQAGWDNMWMVLAFPVMIGFSVWTTSDLAVRKARRSASRILLYGAGMILIGIICSVNKEIWMVVLGSLVSIGVHEWIVQWAKREEGRKRPMFVHDHRGLKVLTTNSAPTVQNLGILSGEIIHRVNGQTVMNVAELHEALRLNPAFVKLEVVDHHGELKPIERALNAREHHQLGLFFAPSDDAMYYADEQEGGIFTFLRYHRKKRAPYGQQSSASTPTPDSSTISL